MNNQLDENTNNVGLYKVNYLMRNEERSMDMLLSTGRKRRNDIKVMIALLMGIRRAEINGVKLRFRKRITCFSSGVEGTIAYLQLIEFQKKKRKRLYSRYHIKKCPFKPQSKTIKWSRHLYLGLMNYNKTY